MGGLRSRGGTSLPASRKERGATTTRDRGRFAATTRLTLVTLRSLSASGTSAEGGAEVCSMEKRSLNVAAASLESCANAPSGAASISDSAVLARMRS